MLSIISFAHSLLEETVQPGDQVIDATCGNGNDTYLLSTLVEETGIVYACDIQEQAIATTKEIMQKHQRHNVYYILDSHSKLTAHLPKSAEGNIAAVIFNLGYLPKSDKTIITQPDTTSRAINELLPYLKKQGRLILVIYHGHEGGSAEKSAVLKLAQELDQKCYQVLQYQFINQQNTPPFIVAIEKNS